MVEDMVKEAIAVSYSGTPGTDPHAHLHLK
jgi:hypothetical protein